MEKKLRYSNDEITVIWKPDLCIHSAECVKGSPSVFRPAEKPWVNIDGGSADELKRTIDKCPSGALSYQLGNARDEAGGKEAIRIKTSKNGPLLISGKIVIEDAEGNLTVCDNKTTALCRCGASRNKPFCDGSHSNVKFFG